MGGVEAAAAAITDPSQVELGDLWVARSAGRSPNPQPGKRRRLRITGAFAVR